MRTAEEEVLNAEKWSSLAWLDGAKYPADELTEDWKKVLFNQFHDLAAGSGIADIYKDAQKDYGWVRMSTEEISTAALSGVDETVKTEGAGIPIIVYNPLGWKRSGEITARIQDDTGVHNVTTPVADVPALGYKVVHYSTADSRTTRCRIWPATSDEQSRMMAAAITLENGHVARFL